MVYRYYDPNEPMYYYPAYRQEIPNARNEENNMQQPGYFQPHPSQQPMHYDYLHQAPLAEHNNEALKNTSNPIMQQFLNDNGQIDVEKMLKTIGQLADTVQQVSPVIKQVNDIIKSFR